MDRTVVFNLLAAAAVTCAAAGDALGQQTDTLSTSGSVTMTTDRMEHYPSVDFRNMLTGAFAGMEVIERNGSNLHMAQSQTDNLTLSSGALYFYNRGFSNSLICYVDGLPMPYNQLMLDPDQIETVTLVNDIAAKAKYGPLGSSGVLDIRTRGGSFNMAPDVHFGFESGVAVIDRWPGWVDGVDYARLNNQAREAAGYSILYPWPEAYAEGDAYSLTYPNVDYKSLIFRNTKPLDKVNFSVNGGSEAISYMFGMTGAYEGGFYKVGPETSFTKLNFFSKVNARVNRWITTGVSFLGMMAYHKDNRGTFTSYRTTPAIAFPLEAGTLEGDSDEADVASGARMWGVSRTFGDNPYAQYVEGGWNLTRYRDGVFTANIDVDMGWLLDGLKSTTLVSINTYNFHRVARSNDYLAYYWDQTGGGMGSISSHKGVKSTGKMNSGESSYQELNLYETLSYDHIFGDHKVSAEGVFYMSDTRARGDDNFERQMNFIGSAEYAYKGRYVVNVVADYAGCSRFLPPHRYCWFPSAGLAWVLSREPWLRDSKVVNYLKLRAQAGVLGSSNIYGTGYLYDALYTTTSGMTYGPSANGRWFGELNQTSKYSSVSRLANPDLTWEKLRQVDLGVDARLWDGLSVSASLYRIKRDGIITEMTSDIPNVYGLSSTSVYDNYNATLTRGLEAAVQWEHSAGEWKYSVGGTASSYKTIRKRVNDDLWLYEYQRKAGTTSDAIWGYEYLGKFTDVDDWMTSPKYDDNVKMGDLKYADLDGDGQINTNDRKVIGHSSPRLVYSINASLGWKNFDIYVLGTGRAFFDVLCDGDWFQGGSGDDNYSTFVRDNLGGDYPRLSYVRAEGNFVTSKYWLRRGDWFKIQCAELGWNVPVRKGNKAGLSGARVFVRGANLLTISGLKTVDPENIYAGVTVDPMYKTYTAGVTLKF